MAGYYSSLRRDHGRMIPYNSSYAAQLHDPHRANVISLITMDAASGTTMVDHAGKVWTAVGNAVLVPTGGKDNYAASFDGSGDAFSTPDSTDWNFGAGDWTVEFTAKKASASANYMIASQISSGPFNGFQLQLSASAFTMTAYSGGTGISMSASVTHDTAVHEWAMCRVGTLAYIFRDGVLLGTATAAAFGDSTGLVRMGLDWDGSSTPMNGTISRWRWTKGVGRYTKAYAYEPFALTA